MNTSKDNDINIILSRKDFLSTVAAQIFRTQGHIDDLNSEITIELEKEKERLLKRKGYTEAFLEEHGSEVIAEKLTKALLVEFGLKEPKPAVRVHLKTKWWHFFLPLDGVETTEEITNQEVINKYKEKVQEYKQIVEKNIQFVYCRYKGMPVEEYIREAVFVVVDKLVDNFSRHRYPDYVHRSFDYRRFENFREESGYLLSPHGLEEALKYFTKERKQSDRLKEILREHENEVVFLQKALNTPEVAKSVLLNKNSELYFKLFLNNS